MLRLSILYMTSAVAVTSESFEKCHLLHETLTRSFLDSQYLTTLNHFFHQIRLDYKFQGIKMLVQPYGVRALTLNSLNLYESSFATIIIQLLLFLEGKASQNWQIVSEPRKSILLISKIIFCFYFTFFISNPYSFYVFF